MQTEIIASLIGTLITAAATIIVALSQKSHQTEIKSQPSIIVPQGYKAHKPKNLKKRNLWLLVVPLAILGGFVGYRFGSLLKSPPIDIRIRHGADGIVVVENQKLHVDNLVGKETLYKHEQLVRNYTPVVDLTITSEFYSANEDIIRELILKNYEVSKQQVCDIEIQVPSGQIREYQIEWIAYWQEGEIFDRDDILSVPIGTYKVVLAYACNIVKDQAITP